MNEPLYPREGNSGWTHRLVRPPPPEPYPPLPPPHQHAERHPARAARGVGMTSEHSEEAS